MQNIGSISSVSSLKYQPTRPWYVNDSFKLNNILPSYIEDFTTDQHWDSVGGSTKSPYSLSRNGNATQIDSQGRLVWAQANMIPRSQISGGAVGVLGSGGAMPNGWTWGVPDVGITREILEITSQYLIVRMYGVNTNSVSISYPHLGFAFANLIVPVIGQSYTATVQAQLVAGSYAGTVTSQTGRLTMQWRTGAGAYLSETANSNAASNVDTRLVSTGIAPATAAQCSPQINLSINPLGVIDMTFKLYAPQVEPNGIDSPKPYLATNGTARYAERLDYDPQTLAVRGYLIEPTLTNLVPLSSSNVPADWNTTSFTTATSAGFQWSFPVITITSTSTTNPAFSYPGLSTLNAVSGTVYAVSAFVKKTNFRYVQLTTSSNYNPGAWVNYDFDTNTFTENGVGGIIPGSAHAQLHQNGWVRLQFGFTANSTASGAGVIIGFPNDLASGRLVACTTAGVSVSVFGTQIENNQFASSHIPTFGSSATRSADQVTQTSIPWFNQTKGTWYVEAITNQIGVNTRRFLDISDGTASIRLQVTRGPSSTVFVGNPTFAPASTNPPNK